MWGLLIPIRHELDKYVNLRPIRIQPGVTSPLAGLTSLDIVVVRENVEGLSKRSSGKSSSMKTAARKAVQAATRLNVWLYRRTNGRVGGSGMGGLPLLLLTVPGRRSGTPYTVPVAYFEHTGKHLVVGTGMGGSKETPQWFRNLAVAGAGRIRVRDQDHDVEARLASAAEREEFWDVIAARAPHFDKWQVRIGRSFPVAVLTPRSSPQVSEPA